MPRPFPQPNFNSTVGLFEHTNSLTKGWATTFLPVVMFIIIFVILKTKFYKTSDCLLVSSMLSTFFSVLLWGTGLLAGKILVVFVLMTIGSAIYSIFDS